MKFEDKFLTDLSTDLGQYKYKNAFFVNRINLKNSLEEISKSVDIENTPIIFEDLEIKKEFKTISKKYLGKDKFVIYLMCENFYRKDTYENHAIKRPS